MTCRIRSRGRGRAGRASRSAPPTARSRQAVQLTFMRICHGGETWEHYLSTGRQRPLVNAGRLSTRDVMAIMMLRKSLGRSHRMHDRHEMGHVELRKRRRW
jgi:hypothetical protein